MARLIKWHELKDFIGKKIIYQSHGIAFEAIEDEEIIIFSINEVYITYDDMMYDFLGDYDILFRFWTEKPTKEQWDSDKPIDYD